MRLASSTLRPRFARIVRSGKVSRIEPIQRSRQRADAADEEDAGERPGEEDQRVRAVGGEPDVVRRRSDMAAERFSRPPRRVGG